MSVQLYSHSKSDIEKAVEIVLQKIQFISKESNPNPPNASELITQKDAASFLKVSIPTLIDWRKNKSLPHYEYNGRFFYSIDELLEYGRKQNQKK